MAVEILQAIDRWRHASGSPESDVLAETLTKTHGALLNEAWQALDGELRERGNTPKVLELLRLHSQRITGYWRRRVEQYLAVVAPQPLPGSPRVRIDGEEIMVQGILNPYEGYVDIERGTSTETDKVHLRFGESGEVSDLFGPQVESEVKSDPEGDWGIRYKVSFKDGTIKTFKRTVYYEDPEGKRSSVGRVEELDFSGLVWFLE